MEVSPFIVFVASIFTSNMILSNFLGMCSFIAVSKEKSTAWGLGQAVTFVLTGTSVINYLVYHYVLVPYGLVYLRYIVFILLIAAFVQLVEMVIERYFPVLHLHLGIFLPLITVNCAVFGVSLFTVIRQYNLFQATAFGFGSGIGWTLAIVALAGIRQKIKNAPLPKGLEGAGITLIITGIMALAFIGFSGIIHVQ
ncbi:MAG: NADH:ubiquinone reductase (Na(+)-transporting) subunit E [Firmicutes bacterium]|jgi:Na+-transporting NADH:ubiquinone oxidoreductase subunit E|nr:NADH:ubiquinone reductase (Na(+)-transporting) subunit E [Bacillota bacterium]